MPPHCQPPLVVRPLCAATTMASLPIGLGVRTAPPCTSSSPAARQRREPVRRWLGIPQAPGSSVSLHTAEMGGLVKPEGTQLASDQTLCPAA